VQSRSSLVFVVLVTALGLREWGLAFGLPYTFARPDEEATVSTALRFFGRHLDPQFFDWPPLFMYAVTAAFIAYFNLGRSRGWFPHESTFLVSASTNPAPLHLLAREVSAIAGTLTVWIVQRIGLRMFDRATANAAAFFLAVAALHVRDSHFGVPDVAATCLAMLSFLWTLRFAESQAWRHALASAALAGLAASTKYNVGLIAVPGLLAVVNGARDTVVKAPSRLTLSCSYVAVALLTFFAATPFALIEWRSFLRALESIATHLGRGHIAPSGPAWQVHLSSSLWYGVGWPLLIAALAGIALYCRQNRRAGLVFASFPALYFLAIGSGETAFARYIIPVIPFLCLAAAYLVAQAASRAVAWIGRPSLRGVVVGALALAVAWPSLSSAIQTDRILTRTDTRVLAAEAIHRIFPCGATVYQSGLIYGHVQMRVADPAHAHAFTPVTFDESTGVFQSGEYAAAELPALIVIQQSPLAYSRIPEKIRRILSQYYSEQEHVDGVDTSDAALVYDYDDAFFVPLAGLRAVTRPGPNVRIYVRQDQPPPRC
jgi:Dolichyl-phosphate-mannose-protein mannosyltransferase